MSHKWSVPLTHTLLPAPHTHTQQNVCRSASPFALNWVINHPTPPPFAFRHGVLFPEPRGLCSLFFPAIYFRGDQVVHIHFACTRMPVFFNSYVGNDQIGEMCACVCSLPIPTPAGFFAKINLPVDDSEILQESHPEGKWGNTSAMLLHQWAEQMNERQWQRWNEKKGSTNGPQGNKMRNLIRTD